MGRRLAVIWLAVLLGPGRADVEAPLVDRPIHVPFSEAIARFVPLPPGPVLVTPFRVEAEVDRQQLEPLAPLRLTVRVRAVGPTLRPPVRLDLRQVAAFDRLFHVEDVSDPTPAGDGSAWTWVYCLRPRSEAVSEVPGVPFLFYNPDIRPPERAYQLICTDPVSLLVRAAERPVPPVELSEAALSQTWDDHLLRPTGAALPGATAGALVLLTPPLLCVAGLVVWRWLRPDALQRARRRRSRAARLALKRLAQARRLAGRRQAEAIGAAVVGYLRDRFDLQLAEPTPDEAERHLAAAGCSGERTRLAVDLLDASARARFQPGDEPPSGLAQRAWAFILAMEETT